MTKHWIIGIVAGLAVALAATATQVSVLRLGDDSYGSTVLVRRTDDLERLRFIDSAEAACSREVAKLQLGGMSEMIAERSCAGELAMKIQAEDRALLRWGVKGL